MAYILNCFPTFDVCSLRLCICRTLWFVAGDTIAKYAGFIKLLILSPMLIGTEHVASMKSVKPYMTPLISLRTGAYANV